MFILNLLLLPLTVLASAVTELPTAPTDPAHPGNKSYLYNFKTETFNCSGRAVSVYLPASANPGEKFPTVVYGHGQALTTANYEGTFEHLAKKGIAVVYPNYDKGFFDQDWKRMGSDYNAQAACALNKFPQLNQNAVLYSGHSKGAYVASIAAGQTAPRSTGAPRAVLLFQTAGVDEATAARIDPAIPLTVIYSDADTIVDRSLSERLLHTATNTHKQLITILSYTTTKPVLRADHMWPLTKGTVFGGGSESALHYYGAWKWLVGAAEDLRDGSKMTNPYIYGALATDKGGGLNDQLIRSW